tara:strand:- start:598 stop:1605 length:1008 start_codon:yes stop_codon:yes gene_type:complete
MGFKLKSGNKTSFKMMGSKAPFKQDEIITGEDREKDDIIWKEETNEGDIDVSDAISWMDADLKSEGYLKRLENELKLKGNVKYKRAPTEEEIKLNPDVSFVTEYNPTSENIMDVRTNRLKNIIWNKPMMYDKEGKFIDYAHADHIRKGDSYKTNRLMESSNVYFSDRYDWQGGQKKRLLDLGIHEGEHGITAGVHGMLEGTKSILNKAKGGSGESNQFDDNELAKPQEVYARYKVTQKFLQDRGIFDAFSGETFTNKHYNQIQQLMDGVTADNFKEKGIPYEVFTFFGDDKDHPHGFNKKLDKKDMKNIFNNVAQEPGIGGFEVQDDFGGSYRIT